MTPANLRRPGASGVSCGRVGGRAARRAPRPRACRSLRRLAGGDRPALRCRRRCARAQRGKPVARSIGICKGDVARAASAAADGGEVARRQGRHDGQGPWRRARTASSRCLCPRPEPRGPYQSARRGQEDCPWRGAVGPLSALPVPSGASQEVRCAPVILFARSVTTAIIAGARARAPSSAERSSADDTAGHRKVPDGRDAAMHR